MMFSGSKKPEVHPSSVLFVVLDSCRYDTFEKAQAPNMKAVGPLHKAQSPSYFTYGSHSAMFMGFTPGLAERAVPLLNPKLAKLFKIVGAGWPGKGDEAFEIQGSNIIDGFNRLGYSTIGTAAVSWFDDNTATGRMLTHEFQNFWFAGNSYSLEKQLSWLDQQIDNHAAYPMFTFINIGETHVPYWFEGAPWSKDDNPCVPFQKADRAQECAMRQKAACEWVDGKIAPLLQRFSRATTLICADHGDCWGEDGLWEHGISHEKTLTVPLIMRVFGQSIANGTEHLAVRDAARITINPPVTV